jgi:hypothetical protein
LSKGRSALEDNNLTAIYKTIVQIMWDHHKVISFQGLLQRQASNYEQYQQPRIYVSFVKYRILEAMQEVNTT